MGEREEEGEEESRVRELDSEEGLPCLDPVAMEER